MFDFFKKSRKIILNDNLAEDVPISNQEVD